METLRFCSELHKVWPEMHACFPCHWWLCKHPKQDPW